MKWTVRMRSAESAAAICTSLISGYFAASSGSSSSSSDTMARSASKSTSMACGMNCTRLARSSVSACAGAAERGESVTETSRAPSAAASSSVRSTPGPRLGARPRFKCAAGGVRVACTFGSETECAQGAKLE
eukprot:643689-Pleurochrysis_carterae.AAC.1